MENPGKRKFSVAMRMPTEEDPIHQPDQQKDEEEYEGSVKIGVEFL